jgi:hypothetical protein
VISFTGSGVCTIAVPAKLCGRPAPYFNVRCFFSKKKEVLKS